MTIAMIGQKGLPARSGGIERHVEALALGLAARGHRVVVFGRRWYVGSARPPKGIEQHLTSGIHTKHLDAITHSLTALWAARAVRPSIVHIHGIGVALLAPLARLLFPRAKVVVTFHCLDRRFSKWGWFARLVFLTGEWMASVFAHEMVTVSQELARYLLQTYGRRATYIPHAFAPVALSQSSETSGALVRAEGLTPGTYLLFVGRLLSHKGADRLIRAYALLRQHFSAYADAVDLVIVGGSSFTDVYAQEVQALARQTPGVVLLGERHGETLSALQAHALAHAFPSTEEGLSLAVLEGASSGRPVLVHSLEANREATGGHALEVDARSLPALAGGLLGLIMMEESVRLAQGRALAAYVRRAFDAQTAVDDMDRLYRQAHQQEEWLVTPVLMS